MIRQMYGMVPIPSTSLVCILYATTCAYTAAYTVYMYCFQCIYSETRGVGNNLKFCRSTLKLFLKDEILLEICTV